MEGRERQKKLTDWIKTENEQTNRRYKEKERLLETKSMGDRKKERQTEKDKLEEERQSDK